ncbi:hypothetical protein C8R47DRAFT_1296955 [Mycena vitilis]|nr:hypothetical protein C8R47DRAFT_1264381 [Mycena vitilis]KAJ6472202.1 hypothetical protein C8R47DRAFT_1296955 [Mycena vitilis]
MARYDPIFSGVATASAIWLYHALQTVYTAERQRAWIITGISSAVMALGSIPFVMDLALSYGDLRALRPRFQHATLICRTFQGFLLADLIVGYKHYRASITVCWGWIHHSVYIVLLNYTIHRQWAHIFCLCACMELPTLHLSLSFLHPRLRHDWLFCGSLLATRIILHLFLLHAFCSPRGMAATHGSRLPALGLALAFPGHAMWFMQSIRGTIRRSQRLSSCQVDQGTLPGTALLDHAVEDPALVDHSDGALELSLPAS